MRYFIEFAYNGKNYFGFQKQPDAISIQETLDKALNLLFKTTIEIVGAGRTDSGVHAKQMYAHFDYDNEIDTAFWIKKLNSYLPKDIVIYTIFKVHNDAHARFDAISRTYEYYIHTFKDVFLHEGSWHYYNTLDVNKMNEACKILFEYIDFECFSKVHTDVNTFNCKISEAFWQQNGHHLVFTITADRFLRNMVRAIVGTMINIGIGKVSITDFKAIIESKSRKEAGFSVPAHGLYLVKVKYPYI
ncbi:pseudouridine synthase [Flavobacterium sp. 316]|uniref:tRNA pseudouridine synthase A n=1 Tax=Flavobacterium sediminilitoris TaxID=2024526 RepID=A0ABY4HJN1_9FLAO|nr:MULTISPECIES: tRNA pseudouridine(38-40) synthase TruA [Flavobacterium]KIX22698.1 pseudouridine synthase [Flavobacterium sp. 316]UOX33043.1 tRNA pseudouridine(38-40) synthase TruA [Flavobacterium sediminilitoris]